MTDLVKCNIQPVFVHVFALQKSAALIGNETPIIAAMQNEVYLICNTTSYNEKLKSLNIVPMYYFDTSTHCWSELSPLYGPLKYTST